MCFVLPNLNMSQPTACWVLATISKEGNVIRPRGLNNRTSVQLKQSYWWRKAITRIEILAVTIIFYHRCFVSVMLQKVVTA